MKRIFLSVIVFIFFGINEVLAQCAMCRATVENNVNNGEAGIAPGLNYGILYLFAAPYLLVMIIAYFWYRQSKKQKRSRSFKDLIANSRNN
ncbi:hypothetical protein JKA74_01655 [Marivirga sp. S37H4]|uniref:Uncharacterized protein n=1 Tax=Marivirga aurantiaca TaxID=2802615 RepID=A0A935C5C1_9BACT|nr:hypothetical protein [Marivirga aurantiaca]MBK6263725.1 hypothetical protein [Marivirga aurantiaca]